MRCGTPDCWEAEQRLRKRLHDSTRRNTENRSRIRELENGSEKRQARIIELEAKIEELKKVRDWKDGVVEDYKQRLHELEVKSAARVKELVADCTVCVSHREDELEERNRQHVEIYEKRIHDLKTQVKGLEYQRKDNEETMKKMRAAFKREHVSGSNLVFENHELDERVKELEADAAGWKDRELENQRLAKEPCERLQCKSERDGRLDRIRSLCDRVKELEGSCVDCTVVKKYAGLGDANKELRAHVKDLEDELRRDYGVFDRLRARVKELEADVIKPHWLRDVEAKLRARVKVLEELRETDVQSMLNLEHANGEGTKRIKELERDECNSGHLHDRIKELEGHIRRLRNGMKKDAQDARRRSRAELDGVNLSNLRTRYNELGNAVVEILAHPVPSVGLHNALHDARKLLALEDWETPLLRDKPETHAEFKKRLFGGERAEDTNTWRKG